MNIITYKYVSTVYKNCAPSAAQKNALATAQSWGDTLQGSYKTVFNAGSSLFNSIKGKLDSVLNNPQGYSAADLAAMKSQSLNTAAADINKLNAYVGEKAAVGGSTPGIESGVNQAIRGAGAASILSAESNREANITEKSDELKQQNFENAIKGEEALPGAAFDPSSKMAGDVTNANIATANQANANAQTSDQWIGVVGGLADTAVAGLTGGKAPSNPNPGGTAKPQSIAPTPEGFEA